MLKPALIILLAPSLETSFFKCCPWQVNFRAIKTAEELKTIDIDINKELERGKLFLVPNRSHFKLLVKVLFRLTHLRPVVCACTFYPSFDQALFYRYFSV